MFGRKCKCTNEILELKKKLNLVESTVSQLESKLNKLTVDFEMQKQNITVQPVKKEQNKPKKS